MMTDASINKLKHSRNCDQKQSGNSKLYAALNFDTNSSDVIHTNFTVRKPTLRFAESLYEKIHNTDNTELDLQFNYTSPNRTESYVNESFSKAGRKDFPTLTEVDKTSWMDVNVNRSRSDMGETGMIKSAFELTKLKAEEEVISQITFSKSKRSSRKRREEVATEDSVGEGTEEEPLCRSWVGARPSTVT